ncbi:MAG: GNAT family N-acetyltransferase [Bacteroidetes bacterium]|nr:GNAT family N-acetyltransferase [Bacteroidota bacterium]
MTPAQQAYRTLCTEAPGPLFAQPRWLDATLGPAGWGAVVNLDTQGMPVAGLALPLLRKGPFSMIDLPAFTPHIGPVFAVPEAGKSVSNLLFAQEQLNALLAQIPRYDYFYLELPPYTDGLPFHAAGYQLLTRYTHLLDLRPQEAELWDNLRSSLRGQLRKAQRTLEVVPAAHPHTLYHLLQATYTRQRLQLRLTESQLQRTLTAIPGQYRLWHATDAGGRVHAALCMLYHEQVATIWISAQDYLLREHAAASLLHWHAICTARQLGCHTLDFEGSLNPGIARFYRTFGSTPVPYLAVRKTRSLVLKALRLLKGSMP